MARVTAVDDADLEGSLQDWRQFRRTKRVGDIHWIDALYQAYLTGIIAVVAIALATGAVGDELVSGSELQEVRAHGPAWLGGLAALAIAVGLRSGSRGGPLALERAEVRHVLLAPVDRLAALRAPALRQLRFLAFVGAMTGAVCGHLAHQRLPGGHAAWIGTGLLGGVTLVGLGAGAALVAGGLRIPRWLSTAAGVTLVAAAVADGLDLVATSPTRAFGDLVLLPLGFKPVSLAPVAAALVAVVVGVALLGRASIEAAERRSTLVGQLRFAATLQDLRTVIVLRRQLAMELPRNRPWVNLRVAGTGRLPLFVRGVRGVLRWPAARVTRMLLVSIVVGLALRGLWAGTTPLLVLAGLALFVAGLDAVEPLAQEVDHPSRRDAAPLERGAVHLAHVPVGVLVMLGVGALAAIAAGVPGPGRLPIDVDVVVVVPLALAGLAGALVSLISGPPTMSEGWSLAPPEAQGIRLALRTVWPPALATLGAVPVLTARHALDAAGHPAEAARATTALVLVVFGLVCGWVRVRDQITEWWAAQMELSQAAGRRSTDG